jgi:hypothetical protein
MPLQQRRWTPARSSLSTGLEAGWLKRGFQAAGACWAGRTGTVLQQAAEGLHWGCWLHMWRHYLSESGRGVTV